MQCQSYLPVYRSHYDLNVDANGGATPLYNNSVHYNHFVSSPPIPRGPFHYKELLRQTMLMHEVTFKDQVQELHRLYRRQEELMGEIKSKQVYMNQLNIEFQSSNSTPARISAGCDQNTLCNLPFINSHTPPSTGRNNIQISNSFEEEPKPPSSPVAVQNGDTLNDLQNLEYKGRKIRGKLLDLELPAETYIDSDEEEERLEYSRFSEAFTPTTPSSNKRTKVVAESDVTASTENRSLLQSPRSFSGTNTNLADLNEPLGTSYLELQESDGDKKTNSSLESSEKIRDQFGFGNTTSDDAADKLTVKSPAQSDMTKSEVVSASCNLGKKPLVVQALPSSNNQIPYSKGANIRGRKKGVLNKFNGSSRRSPTFNVEKLLKKGSKISMLSNIPDTNCIDLNSDIVAISKFETVKKSKRCRVIDINLPCDLTADDDTADVDESALQDDCKNLDRLNLNSCTDGSESQVKSSSLDKILSDINLEAPISPEVEEGSPPRGGDSEENQPEEDCDVLLELTKIAAEAIVSFSSSKCRSYPETVNLKKCEAASDSGNLEWFAGLVDSLSIDLERDIDDFEAMTLELPEMKAEDYCCRNKNDAQISSETCSDLFSCQTRKGRTRRSKRKDFQREVLPSLASLSRYEVTEDIQMIEGLMEAAGTPWQLSRARRACRMGRKPRVAKQQKIFNGVYLPELQAPVSWGGGINRRPRGRRSPVSETVLSKWFHYVI